MQTLISKAKYNWSINAEEIQIIVISSVFSLLFSALICINKMEQAMVKVNSPKRILQNIKRQKITTKKWGRGVIFSSCL